MQSAHMHVASGERKAEVLRILYSESVMKTDSFKLCCLKFRPYGGAS